MKEKINFFFKIVKKNRDRSMKICITAILAIAIIATSLTVSYAITNKESKEEKLLKTYLQELGIDFYENVYYNQIGHNDDERKVVLEKFKDIGIKISLNNIEKNINDTNKEKLLAFTNQDIANCDKDNTKIIIYPEAPYKIDSYHFEIELVCEFYINK